eukprot:8670158-Lingulodinium_polyedra.AAC.1
MCIRDRGGVVALRGHVFLSFFAKPPGGEGATSRTSAMHCVRWACVPWSARLKPSATISCR